MANNDLTIVTAALTEHMTLPFVKNYLRVDNTADDDFIVELIEASRQIIERGTGRQLVTATYDWRLDGFSDVLMIPKPPLTSVTSVKYLDEDGSEQTLAADQYDVHVDRTPGEIRLAFDQSWPSLRGGHKDVTVRFVCGYGDLDSVPSDLRLLSLKIISRDYELRVPGALTAEDWVEKQLRWSNKVAEVY